MNTGLTYQEGAQRFRAFSEPLRIEYLRRLDGCHAVLNSAAPLVLEQSELDAEVKEHQYLASAKWPWIVVTLGAGLVWVGKELEVGFVAAIGYVLVFGIAMAFIQAAWRESKALRRKSALSNSLANLQFQWAAFGGNSYILESYCRQVSQEGTQPDLDEFDAELREQLLHRVGNARDPD